MTIQGFPETMRQLSERVKKERERLDGERELLADERSRYFHHDDPILEDIIGNLRREAERAERIVKIWAWIIGGIVLGGMTGLLFWYLTPAMRIGVGVIWGGSLIGVGYVAWDSFWRRT